MRRPEALSCFQVLSVMRRKSSALVTQQQRSFNEILLISSCECHLRFITASSSHASIRSFQKSHLFGQELARISQSREGSSLMSNTDRRTFLQLLGLTAASTLTTLKSNIAKALAIPANDRTRTIQDVEHIVVLMQENRPFDHHFGTLRGVRGFSDPRAVNINLPLSSGTGTTLASVFLQPAGATNVAAGFAVPPDTVGGPADGVEVIPPFRVNPASISPGLKSLGLTYFPGTDHSWSGTHAAWDEGQYDMWPSSKGPISMSYMTRVDIPYHYALADAFTVGDAYHCSIMGPTNPNRTYMWTGCIGNLSNLGPGG